jgi:hypothetical protein
MRPLRVLDRRRLRPEEVSLEGPALERLRLGLVLVRPARRS